jgi:diguanylate cyclase (GGDEF)-like protein
VTGYCSHPAAVADDDAWNDGAESRFHGFLPAILGEVFAVHAVGDLVEAIRRGAEELIVDATARIDDLDAVCLRDVIFDVSDTPRPADDTINTISFRPSGVEVSVPLSHEGLRLADVTVTRSEGRWIYAQERGWLRRYADLVAPTLYQSLHSAELRRAALTDELTGVANRRALDHELDRLFPSDGPLCLLLLDIDGLKQVNDTLGYSQGDHLITTLAQALTGTLKRHHVVARLGGDEFVVILPGTTTKQARKWAKRIRRAFARQPLQTGVAKLTGGVSIGVVQARPREQPRQVIRRAARSMQSQKRRRVTDTTTA